MPYQVPASIEPSNHGVAAQASTLEQLRLATRAEECASGATFDGSSDIPADADLIAAGTLIDVKSIRRVHDFPLPTVYQLLGYVLMEYSDRYRIDAVGVYLSRAGVGHVAGGGLPGVAGSQASRSQSASYSVRAAAEVPGMPGRR
ncbi:hypothetical protein [Nonomuraea jiangxiensis]|uniref:hypothetical protein n=1 Tax=Nonomuraea jiangxiensis TaxID=633440 RepID=UPI00115FDB91|nr:hypothetical protein [Nonomuraea jiangxiensis]